MYHNSIFGASFLKEYAKQIFKQFYHLSDSIKQEYSDKRNHTSVLNKDVLETAETPVRHGALHVSRVAYYVPVLANFLRASGNKKACELSQEEVVAMQVAALLHDSGRSSDLTGDAPHSDSEIRSVGNCIEFMKNNDIIALEKSYQICHAASAMQQDGPDVYQKILKSADSLDVLRADDFVFDPKNMDIYADASPKDRKVLNSLIDSVKEQLVAQGDSPQDIKSFSEKNRIIKGNFDTEKRNNIQNGDTYSNVEMAMNQSSLLNLLYNNGKLLLSKNKSKLEQGGFKKMIESESSPVECRKL